MVVVSGKDIAIVPVESGEQRDLLQRHRLRPTHHQIHVLDCLTRSPLNQIVECRDEDGASWNAILCNSDKGHIGPPHMTGLRCFAKRQDMHEGLLHVRLYKYRMKVFTRPA